MMARDDAMTLMPACDAWKHRSTIPHGTRTSPKLRAWAARDTGNGSVMLGTGGSHGRAAAGSCHCLGCGEALHRTRRFQAAVLSETLERGWYRQSPRSACARMSETRQNGWQG